MKYCFLKPFVFVALALYLIGCATGPAEDRQSAKRIATAGQFLHNINFGELAVDALQRSMAKMAVRHPSMAEVTRRAFSDLSTADFDQVGAQVYAKHLTQEQLSQLLAFSKTPTGRRFFQIAIASSIQGVPLEQDWLMDMFNPDELTEILRFGQSEAALALRRNGSQINRELAMEAESLGRELFQRYLNDH